MAKKYLDLIGLQSYDELIKLLIDDKVGNGGTTPTECKGEVWTEVTFAEDVYNNYYTFRKNGELFIIVGKTLRLYIIIADPSTEKYQTQIVKTVVVPYITYDDYSSYKYQVPFIHILDFIETGADDPYDQFVFDVYVDEGYPPDPTDLDNVQFYDNIQFIGRATFGLKLTKIEVLERSDDD